MATITVDRDKCDGCGRCVELCPMGILIISEGDEKKAKATEEEWCMVCQLCETECHKGAIKVVA